MIRVPLFNVSLPILLFVTCSCKKQPKAEENTAVTAETATEAPMASAVSTKAPDAAAAPADAGLPGSAELRTALAHKDYSGAVERLSAIKAVAVGDIAWAEYRQLTIEVGEKLEEAAKTDAKAAEALVAYRIAVYGR